MELYSQAPAGSSSLCLFWRSSSSGTMTSWATGGLAGTSSTSQSSTSPSWLQVRRRKRKEEREGEG